MNYFLKRTSFTLSVMLAIVACALRPPELFAENLRPRDVPVPASYFGLHIHYAYSTTPWPFVPFGAWRLWDAYAAWPWVEPKKGEWKLENVDKMVELALKNNVDVIMPLALSPYWASARPQEKSAYGRGAAAEPGNMEDWRNYVRTIANRYKGKVRYYEIWNEPNLVRFYSGSMDQLVVLTMEASRILKEVDPTNRVVSPSATRGEQGDGVQWLEDFLSKGGGKHIDVVGYHFYVAPGPPESMVPVIRQLRGVMEKHGVGTMPLWNTEAGWGIHNEREGIRGLSDDQAAGVIARAYIIGWAAGLERYYWYAWDNKNYGLVSSDGQYVKKVAQVYGVVFKWLVGSRMGSCSSDRSKTWVCDLGREGGDRKWIVWNPEKRQSFMVPREWNVRQVSDLYGARRNLGGSVSVDVGPVPVLLERN